MKYSSATHVGRVRQENEDYIIAKDSIFIVADGMGGHNAGDVASKLAAQTVYKNILNIQINGQLDILENILKKVNKKVIDRAQSIQDQSGMGTTFTMAKIEGKTAEFAHVGDSRAYLLRDNKLKQITQDHSLVAEMVRQGKITKKEAREHPYRNVITKAIGSDPNLEADYFSITLKPKDRLLLASDGLTGMLKDAQIKKILLDSSAKEATDNLIKQANEKGGTDNTSVIIIDIDENDSKKLVKKNTITHKLASVTIALLIILTVIGGFFLVSNNSYYLAGNKGKIAIYKGLPYKIAGISLSKVIFVSDIKVNEVDSTIKKRLVKKISVKNEKEGRKAIEDIGDELGQ